MLFYYAYWELSALCIVTLPWPEDCEKALPRAAACTLEEYLWGTPHRQKKKKHTDCQTLVIYVELCERIRDLHTTELSDVSLFFFWEFVCIDCDVFVLLFPLPVFSISSISLPVFSLTLTVFLCCYLSTAHQAPPAGYAAEPLPHRTKQPGIHWYAVQQSHELSLWRFVYFSASEVRSCWILVLSVEFMIWLYLIT